MIPLITIESRTIVKKSLRYALLLFSAFLLLEQMSFAQPVATATSNTPVCAGSTIVLTGGPSLMLTYSWTGPNGFTSNVQSPTIPNATAAMAGLYTLTVTDLSGTGNASTTVAITPLPTANLSYSGTPFCKSLSTPQAPTLTGTNAYTGGTYSSVPAGLSIDAFGNITPSLSTAGTYTVTYTIPASGNCASIPVNATVTITALPVATFSYTGEPYCSNETNPLPTFSGGGVAGTFSSTAGLSYTPSTGLVNLALSTPGTYTVTNTISAANGCSQVTATSGITITQAPTASLSYPGSPYCKSVSSAQLPTLTGTGSYTGGTFSALPAGLTYNASTGAITPSTSTAGTYTVTYNIPGAGGCPGGTATATVVITAVPVATFSYTGDPYCSSEANPSPTFSGGGVAGNFTAPGGLSINASTGQVNLALSTAGTYTVTNTINSAGCGIIVATAPITITKLPVATFSYAGSPYCSSATNPLPTYSGGGVAGTFTSTAGLIINASTGEVNLATSTPGTYTVTNTIAAAGGCAQVTATASIRITAQPAAVIYYTGSPWCVTSGVQSVTLTGTTGGTFTASPATGLSINASTGAITTSTSTPGTYTVLYSIAANGGCSLLTTATSVTITASPTAPVIGSLVQPTCSVATGSVSLSGLPASGTWTLTRNPDAVTSLGTGSTTTLTGVPAGTFTYTVANQLGCISPASSSFTINAQPPSPAVPVSTVDCTLGAGHAVVTISSPLGADLSYSLDGGAYQTLASFSSVTNGSHYISVRNLSGCTTPGSLFSVSCGCANPPTLTLSSLSGSTCGTTPVVITGNTFGGSATSVSITSNGAGILNPTSTTLKPFDFSYTPAITDAGKIISITVTTDNPLGAPCAAATAVYALTVNAIPTAPVIGSITNLTCSLSTGSVALSGLPVSGVWTLTASPGGAIQNGSGASATFSSLAAGTYTFTVTSATGCISPSSASATVNPAPSAPSAPVIGTITQPTCATSTGSVALSGLPATGTWTLTQSPGGITITGSGVSTTVSTLSSGTYTFTVTNSTGCMSSASGSVVINPQPAIPTAPVVGAVTAPTCTVATGSVVLSGLPATGTWTIIRYPGTISTTGTGTITTIPLLPPGTYNFTVTSAEGCLSGASTNAVIPAQPVTPNAPTIGTITQPTFSVTTGSVVLTGLPASGTWTITRLPGNATVTGTGTSRTISGLPAGVFTFTVTNSVGCISAESAQVIISTPGVPVLTITNPAAVCSPSTVDITKAEIVAGSTPGLTYTYWTDAAATTAYTTPTTATAGTYYIKGTTVSGYFNIKPVVVTIDKLPVPDAGQNQILDYIFVTSLDATLKTNETGIWTLFSGTGTIASATNPKTEVTDLTSGDNLFIWSVSSGVCPVVRDTVSIVVRNLTIPTLITPNMDGRNDYFVLKGITTLGKTELVVFDRRGAQVYKNSDYDNTWNGVDYNGKELPDDTYFYVIKSQNGKSISGYIVIRR